MLPDFVVTILSDEPHADKDNVIPIKMLPITNFFLFKSEYLTSLNSNITM